MTRRARNQMARRRTGADMALAVVGALGELLITAGLVILLYVAWQMWWQDSTVSAAQTGMATELQEQWRAETPDPDPSTPVDTDPDNAPVAVTPAEGSVWGLLYVPRFGDDWIRPIAEGTDMTTVLNRIGVGKYSETTMPGAIGNTVLASHRAGMGSSFYDIDKLRLGDQIIIETVDGWYTYTYRNTEYVMNTAVEILAAVPGFVGAQAGARVLSLQSCTPLPFTGDERIIAYAELTAWQARSAGAPAIVLSMEGAA